MATPYGPPWIRGPVPRRGSRYPSPDLRVSDAERAEVADRLSKHYADGRLDQAEFAERLDQAMAAKTHRDLGGLCNDLPPLEGTDVVPHRSQGGRPRSHRWLFIVVLIVVTAMVAHSLAHFYHPWLLLGIVISVVLLRNDFRRRRS